MADDLVAVYEALTLGEAQLLVERLSEAGIESFVDNSNSPFDGLTAAGSAKIVRVLPRQETDARRIAQEFEKENHQSVDDLDEQAGDDEA